MCEISLKWVLFLYGVLQNIWSSRFGVDSCVSVVLESLRLSRLPAILLAHTLIRHLIFAFSSQSIVSLEFSLCNIAFRWLNWIKWRLQICSIRTTWLQWCRTGGTRNRLSFRMCLKWLISSPSFYLIKTLTMIFVASKALVKVFVSLKIQRHWNITIFELPESSIHSRSLIVFVQNFNYFLV